MLNFLKVWTRDGDYFNLEVNEEPRVDVAVCRYIESNETRDTLLDVVSIEGFPTKILASWIVGWLISTPEGRRRSWEVAEMQKEENKIFEDEIETRDWSE